MPATATAYACDYPGCTNTFDMSVGYSMPTYMAMTGLSQVGSFMCPVAQHICCSVEHSQLMAPICITNHLIPSLQAQATDKGTSSTLVMTAPTS